MCMKSEEFSNYSIVMSSKFNFFVPAERNCGARRAARLIAGFGPIRPSYAPLERIQSIGKLRGCTWVHVGHMGPPHYLP